MKRLLNLLLPVVVCFMVGFTASYFQSDAIESWYPYLNKPALTPPNAVFPIAWGIIYVCMGISIGFILNSKDKKKNVYPQLFLKNLAGKSYK
jgi:benzodiazapine receptor